MVLVTGAPGSGKSTLARELARELRVPYLARDDVRGGLLFSAGAWSDSLEAIPSSDEAVALFLDLVEMMLDRRVSCVVEYVVRRHRPNDLDRLLAAGDCVVVKTECSDPTQRFVDRNLYDRLISNPAVLDAIGHETVESHTEVATERMRQVEGEMVDQFPVPTLTVDTDDGYEPPIDDIVQFVTQSL